MLKAWAGVIGMLGVTTLGGAKQAEVPFQYQSAFLRVELAAAQPALVTLAVDSLGKGKLGLNPLRAPAAAVVRFKARRAGPRVQYRASMAPANVPPAWSFEFSERQIRLRSAYAPGHTPPALVLNFDPHLCHATLLGVMNEDGSARLPALLHLPDHGTFRITATGAKELALGYDAQRFPEGRQAEDFVRVTLPGASEATPQLEYALDVVAIYPGRAELASDARFDGFRRNFLNIFQLNPRAHVLANHAASDPCAFTVYMYSAMALRTPPLAEGLTALDLLRQTLDRYLGGAKAYGMAGYAPNDPTTRYDYLDSYPSLLIAAADYVRGSKDAAWLEKNYPRLNAWALKLVAMDRDGNGLVEYPASGNSGSWPKKIVVRPANWWDTIGFGHADAYSNALAYHAFGDMTDLARRANRAEDAQLYAERARKIRAVYVDTFYNPATGVLAGWKSADGELHDYYFTFVNGVAITYGLVPDDRAQAIMDRLLSKMREVGYHHFDLGLPGNLIPIRREDYVHLEKRWGGPEREDGSDGFQIYENGGATACYAYFTLQALYLLGRRQEADAMLFPMLRAFEEGGFQGRGPNGMTYDWKAWDGTPHGYEGLLVDGYLTLLAVPSR